MRILVCDLQYSDRSSVNDDVIAIKNSLNDQDLEFYSDNFGVTGFKRIWKLVSHARRGRFDRVVLYSSRVTLAVVLSLLIPRLHYVYHFLPNTRQRLHPFCIWLMKSRVRFAVLSVGLKQILDSRFNLNCSLVPSRTIPLEQSTRLYVEKSNRKPVILLVPGVRPPVRDRIPLEDYLGRLSKNGVQIDQVYVQGYDVPSSIGGVRVEKLPEHIESAAYAELFLRSTFVALHFHPDYELRTSGIVLDAVSSGCVMLTQAHPIMLQYGFPRYPVCSPETANHRPTDPKIIRENLLKTTIIFEEQFATAWKDFLCI